MKLRHVIAAAIIGSAGLPGPLRAGDIAAFQPIGFSSDGGLFAFEEYGIQDGSGFPYSNIFFIDTRKDAFLPGTPIRHRLDDDSAGLAKVRRWTRDKAAPLIDSHGMADNPGLLAAFNPVTESVAATDRLTYRQYAVEPPVGGAFTLVLKDIPFAPSEACKDITPQSAGFSLAFEAEDGAASKRIIHIDTTVPESRNCPTGYRIGGVMVHHPAGNDPVHIVMVQVLSAGFEGRDGRWIAVPVAGAP
ncbi:DUF2259 domain-containing protein [Pararhizobium gei]|uniref:DUF2259 domain-containing protein n=1 Tax=Pararhizobium gei TaxID=1395951 RepID=UPI0023D9DFA8|nr:DUF2259 domain-containing protein [Rhizobium gei]